MLDTVKAKLDEFIDHVRGTTNDLETVSLEICGVRISDMDEESIAYVDDRVFECAVCNWICDSDELSDNEEEQICIDCSVDED